MWFETTYDMQNHEQLHVANWAKWSQTTLTTVVWDHLALTCFGQNIHFLYICKCSQTTMANVIWDHLRHANSWGNNFSRVAKWSQPTLALWFETTCKCTTNVWFEVPLWCGGLEPHWPLWFETTYECVKNVWWFHDHIHFVSGNVYHVNDDVQCVWKMYDHQISKLEPSV